MKAEKELPSRLRPTVEAIRRLLDLGENWDSYGARPIDAGVIGPAVELLARTMKAKTPQPVVVPSPRGGIQFEWHAGGIDLEVEVFPNGQFSVYREEAGKFTEQEGDRSSVEGTVGSTLAELTRRA